ncbi:TetR/AcrR family transcriptional regulator [Intestinimonas sp.]|uniref:TetR/AcrR family transcriptional regulator n=1 Tax=Intestinimonas sp. TaxID=1965293 RepID=UPI00260FE2C9|nr:TetR/AcrR family transcriptional regulator [Intestinimonas sp.]
MDAENKSKRQLQAEQTKDNLFIAAVELLTEKDFDDITIRDIVARAQVSIGTFYNYYSTKMEVFYETYRIADHYFTETVAPLLSQGTVLERIMAFFDYYAHYSSDLTDMRMTKLLYNPDNTFFSRDPHQGMVGVLIGILQQGLDEGALSSDDSAEEIAEYLMIATRGLVYNWCTCNGSYDLATATRKFVRRLLACYLPDDARPNE